jgi:alanine-synthesizing transaminase
MEFRRVDNLPPYVFAVIRDLTLELRRAGEDIVDLGFGNPDLPSPDLAVEKLGEAALNPRNHRYSASKGIPNLRLAAATLYKRRFDVDLDPDTQVLNTIGAKEGLSHLMWVLLEPGDSALVPSPSYPIHIHAPILAGASVTRVPMGADEDLFANLEEAWERAQPKPRVVILSFPHNPTTATVDLAFMERVVAFAREHELLVVHDFAYADLAFDGYEPPSILQVPGAEEVAVELYTLTKSFSMAGWRVGFVVGNAAVVGALARLKSWLDYGTFQPIQIAAIVAMNELPDYPREVSAIYQSRRDALCDGLERAGWSFPKPKGTMFVWAPIPEQFRSLGSVAFAERLAREARVAVSPGIGFGADGDGFVRFALVENEHRIGQAVRGIRNFLGTDATEGGRAEGDTGAAPPGPPTRAGRRRRRAPSPRARERTRRARANPPAPRPCAGHRSGRTCSRRAPRSPPRRRPRTANARRGRSRPARSGERGSGRPRRRAGGSARR